MSQVHPPIASTTPDALRAAIAEAVQVDAHQLQAAVGSIQVASSDQLQVTDPQIKSLYDTDSRILTLLADRIPAGQDAQQFANALVLHLGRQAAVDLLGEEGVTNAGKVQNYIEQPTPATSVPPGPKLYRAEAHAGSDLDVSPSVALFQVDEVTARDIIKLASLVKANDVYKIERFDARAQFLRYDPETSPEDATAAGEENSVRTERECLVVTDSDFYFRAYEKHTNVDVKCSNQSLADLAKHFGLAFGEHHALKVTDQTPENLVARIEADIALLRNVCIDPMSIKIANHLDIEVRPAEEDDRVFIGREGWGGTVVNYTSEGLILDVFGHEELDPVHTVCIYASDLEASKEDHDLSLP